MHLSNLCNLFFITKIPLGGELIIDQLVGFLVVEGDISLDLFYDLTALSFQW
jgi:hypothetical protein